MAPSLTLTDQDILASTRAEVGEGPLWDNRTGRFYWIDITRGRLFWMEEGLPVETHDFRQMIGTVALTADADQVLVALENGLHFFALADRKLEFFAHPAEGEKGNRYNDGKPDPQGRFWIGTMHPDGAEGRGSLYCCHPDGSSTRIQTGLSIPNGLAWSPDGKTFYHTDSLFRRIDAYVFDGEAGSISGRRTAVDLSAEQGVPDGFEIDRDGNIWVAFWGGHSVKAYDPLSGSCRFVVTSPVSQSASCTFGGPGFRHLFVTTAAYRLNSEEPLAGLTFRCSPPATGAPANIFGLR